MKENNYDFDTEFATDDEVEQMLDEFIISLGEAVEAEESRTAAINPDRVKCVLYTYKVMQHLFSWGKRG